MVGFRLAAWFAVALLTGVLAASCAGSAPTGSPAPPTDAPAPTIAEAVATVTPSVPALAPAPTPTPTPAPSLPEPNESMDPGLTGLWSGTVDLAPARTDSAIGMSEIPWLTTVMLGQCASTRDCGGWSNAGLNTSGWGIGCTSSLRYGGTDQGAFTFDETSTLKYGAITQCMGDCRLYLTPTANDKVDIKIGCQNHGYRFDAEGSLERVKAAP